MSSDVPDGTIIRAWLECPECVAASPEHAALEKIANTEMPPAETSLGARWQDRLYGLRSIAREAIGMEDA